MTWRRHDMVVSITGSMTTAPFTWTQRPWRRREVAKTSKGILRASGRWCVSVGSAECLDLLCANVATDWWRVAEEIGLRASAPVEESSVRDVETGLGCRFSESLRALYADTDGLRDEWGYEYVLSISELAARNREFRTQYGGLYMSFDG